MGCERRKEGSMLLDEKEVALNMWDEREGRRIELCGMRRKAGGMVWDEREGKRVQWYWMRRM